MFQKIGDSAEKVILKADVSRRGFLGSAAKLAAGLGATLAALAQFPKEAQARKFRTTCRYKCEDGSRVTIQLPGGSDACWTVISHPDTGVYCMLVNG